MSRILIFLWLLHCVHGENKQRKYTREAHFYHSTASPELYGVSATRCGVYCLSTPACTGFSMAWQSQLHGRKIGNCILDTQSGSSLIAADANFDYYGLCEGNFVPASSGRCYKVMTTSKSWTGAVSQCPMEHPGAHLVALETPEEEAVVAQMAEANGINVFWTGAYRNSGTSDPEKWVHSGETFTPVDWNGQEPDYNINEDCVLYAVAWDPTWKYHDEACSVRFKYICEI